MSDGGTYDHLFSTTVRETLSGDGYGSWRSLTAPDAVSLSFGFPFPDSFPREQLSSCADEILHADDYRALQYGGGEYVGRLREGIAARERDRGVDCEADDVLLTNGATHAIDAVSHTLLDPGDLVLAEAPTFMGALKLFENYGVDVEGVAIDEDGLSVDVLADDLAARRREGRSTPKLVYTIPTFQNPTGTTLSTDRRERLLDLAVEYDFLVLEDDAYGELRYDGDQVSPLAAMDDSGRVLRVGTFSKTIAPGVRTGWLVANDEIRAQVRRMAAGGTNTFTLSTLGRYFEAGHYGPVVEELRDAYAQRRDHMLDCLDRHMPADATWTDPDGGFFVWVELPQGIDADAMLERATEEGVTYLPGSHFFVGDDPSNGLRLSFSHVTPAEMDDGIAALARATERTMAAGGGVVAGEDAGGESS